MNERATRLQASAAEQIGALRDIVAGLEDSAWRRPVPGREKLGDGTLAALALHTADNFQRIAAFVQISDQRSAGHATRQRGSHRVPRLLRGLGHRPPAHVEHDHGQPGGTDRYTADAIDRRQIVDQLSALGDTLGQIGRLTDAQLDAVPPKDSFRFCDGQRSLEQVLSGLLNHQRHQVDALAATAR